VSARWCAVRIRLWCIRAAVRSWLRWNMPVRYATVAEIIDGETERLELRIDALFRVMAEATERMGDAASAERCRREARQPAQPERRLSLVRDGES
jgi:hypothetical protein